MQEAVLMLFWSALALSACVLCCSCARQPGEDAVPAGSPMADSVHFQFAVYFLPVPSGDPLAVLREAVDEGGVSLKIVDDIPETPGEMLVSARVEENVGQEYAPPDLDTLQYFGRGLTGEQAQSLQDCRQALILDFAHPSDQVWPALQAANRLLVEIARATGGLLWDEQTREVFSPDEWHKRRIASWTEGVPNIDDHTTIHAYKKDEYVRAITLGMSKFGLPDVVVQEFSWSLSRPVGHLINVFCQAMAEGAVFEKAGEYELDLRAIRNADVREPQIESLKPNATGIARLSLNKGVWEEGDPPNRLIELGFDRYPGRDIHAKREALLGSFLGWEDSIARVDHDEELLAASERARAQLPALGQAFAAGLSPGEFIQVKAPFDTPDGGTEWMWVEVTSWEGKRIKGLLKNEPFDIPSLHAGQRVEVKEDDVFDYIRRHADGSHEGNETAKIIEKMQQGED